MHLICCIYVFYPSWKLREVGRGGDTKSIVYKVPFYIRGSIILISLLFYGIIPTCSKLFMSRFGTNVHTVTLYCDGEMDDVQMMT